MYIRSLKDILGVTASSPSIHGIDRVYDYLLLIEGYFLARRLIKLDSTDDEAFISGLVSFVLHQLDGSTGADWTTGIRNAAGGDEKRALELFSEFYLQFCAESPSR